MDQNLFYSKKCRMSHDVKSIHNTTLLKKVGLRDLKETVLFPLLLQNDPSLLPEVQCVMQHFVYIMFIKC